MAANEISHEGKIIEITPEYTTVEIISRSACSECHAKGLCGIADEKVKLISLPTDPYSIYNAGDTVNVVMKKSMGMKAVWISYVIPLFILMALILSLSFVIGNEVFVGLIAICAVIVYYIVIFLLRNKLAKEFEFSIKEKAI